MRPIVSETRFLKRLLQDRSQPLGPRALTVVVGNQVVAQLDKDIGTTRTNRMFVNRVPRKVPGIGFVVADTHPLCNQQLDQGARQPTIIGVKHPDLPGSRRTPAQLPGKAVHGKDDGMGQRRHSGKFVMIRAIAEVQTAFDLCCIRVPVGRDDRAVVKLHQKCRVIFAPVGINHQAREI